MLNASAIADKWARNLGSAGESIKAGVQAVTQAPTEKAAMAADRYASGVARAVTDGKYQAGLRRVSLEDWKNATLRKGLNRIAAGAAESKGKMQAFLGDFLPHLEAGQRMLETMPRGDLQTNIQRAVAIMNHNANFKRR
jgi:hypothetical protein